jgi:hypothetical protein
MRSIIIPDPSIVTLLSHWVAVKTAAATTVGILITSVRKISRYIVIGIR